MAEHDELPEELRRVAGLARRAAPPFEVPADLEAATFARLREEAAGAGRRRAGARAVAALAAAAAAGALLALGIACGVGGGADGALELAGVLRSDATAAVAGSVEVRRTALGREVHLRSDDLPVLPVGRFYEVWFVAPDDRPGAPHRISAGTFHPDAHGHSDLTLHAAVDPARFPVVSVTAEDGADGPGPGREVARLSR
ncbi:MAG: anti-sigma factor [Thermoleophilia bacterium]